MGDEQNRKVRIQGKRKKRLIIVSLFILFFACGVLGGGRFIGLLPRYPHSQSLKLCGPPEFKTFGDSTSWHLDIGTCFKTEDDTMEIYSWYEGIGWWGSSQPTDRLGATVTFNAHLGQYNNITTKRQVLVFDNNVLVTTKHELLVDSCIPLPQEAQTWEAGEFGSVFVAFVKTCLR